MFSERTVRVVIDEGGTQRLRGQLVRAQLALAEDKERQAVQEVACTLMATKLDRQSEQLSRLEAQFQVTQTELRLAKDREQAG